MKRVVVAYRPFHETVTWKGDAPALFRPNHGVVLLRLLNSAGDGGAHPNRYVQEQTITTLAMVANTSEAMFAWMGFLFSPSSPLLFPLFPPPEHCFIYD